MKPYAGRWTFVIDEEGLADQMHESQFDSGRLKKAGRKTHFTLQYVRGLAVSEYIDGLNNNGAEVFVRYVETPNGRKIEPKVLGVVEGSDYPAGLQYHHLRGPIDPKHRHIIAQALRRKYDFDLEFVNHRGIYGICHEEESEFYKVDLNSEENIGIPVYREHDVNGNRFLVRSRSVNRVLISPEVVGLIVEGPHTTNERTVYQTVPVPESLVAPATEIIKPYYRTRVRFSEGKSFRFQKTPENAAS